MNNKNLSFDKLSSFLKNTSPESEEIIRELYTIILSTNGGLQADIKWNRLTFALDNDFHHWICAINTTKKSIGLIFHFGGLLNDESGLLIKGSSKFLRKIEIDTLSKVDEKAIRGYLLQAIDTLPYFIKNWKEINQERF